MYIINSLSTRQLNMKKKTNWRKVGGGGGTGQTYYFVAIM